MELTFPVRIIVRTTKTQQIQMQELQTLDEVSNLTEWFSLDDVVSAVGQTPVSMTIQEFMHLANITSTTVENKDVSETAEDLEKSKTTVEDTITVNPETDHVNEVAPSKTISVKLDPSKRKAEEFPASDAVDFPDDVKVYAIGKSSLTKPLEWGIVKQLLEDDMFEKPFLLVRGKASLTETRRQKLEEIAGHPVTNDNISSSVVDTSDGPYFIAKVDSTSNTHIVDTTTNINQTVVDTSEQEQPSDQIQPEQTVDTVVPENTQTLSAQEVTPDTPDTYVQDVQQTNTVIDDNNSELNTDYTPTYEETMHMTEQYDFVPPFDTNVTHDEFGDPFSTYQDSTSRALSNAMSNLSQIQQDLLEKDNTIESLIQKDKQSTSLINYLTPKLPESIKQALDSMLATFENTAINRTTFILQLNDAMRSVATNNGVPSHVNQTIGYVTLELAKLPNTYDVYLEIVRYLTLL